MGTPTKTVWIAVEILRRSQFDSGWQVKADDGTEAWIPDERIIDVENNVDLEVGLSTKIEMTTSYAELKGLA